MFVVLLAEEGEMCVRATSFYPNPPFLYLWLQRWLRSHFDLLEMFLSEEHPDHVLHMEEIRDHLVEDLLPPNPKSVP